MMHRGYTCQRLRRGQAIVELALILPLFIALIAGVFEGGRLVLTISTMNHAINEAARFAALSSTTTVASIQQRAVSSSTWLELSASNITVTTSGTTSTYSQRQLGDHIEVVVNYTFEPLMYPALGSGAISLERQTMITVEGKP